jgi:hypothetical protein
MHSISLPELGLNMSQSDVMKEQFGMNEQSLAKWFGPPHL